MFYYQGKSAKTNLNLVFKNVNQLIKKKSIIFILSDFFDKDYEHSLGTLARKHEIIPLVIQDPIELNFSNPSSLPVIVDLEDMETGQSYVHRLTNKSITDIDYFKSQYQRIFRKLGLEYAEINESSDHLKIIDRILRRHTSRH